ncbi:MAG: PAS domain S-box protein [Thermotogota bacterium]
MKKKSLETLIEQYETIFENVPTSVFLVDVGEDGEFRYERTNHAHEQATGISEEKLKWKTPVQALGQSLGTKIESKYAKCLESGKTVAYEERLDLPVGEKVWFTKLTPIYEKKKPIKIVGISFDITQTKSYETKLKKSEERYHSEKLKLQNVLEGTGTGTWQWDIQEGKIGINEIWAQILGYRLQELEPFSIDDFYSLMHTEDIKPFKEALKYHFDSQKETFNTEYRLRSKKGEWIWIQGKGKVFEWTKDGEPLIMFGTHQDITERKKAERELLHSKELMSYIIRHDPNAIAVFDKDLKFIFASERFLNDYSLKDRTIIGKHHYEVFPDIPEKWRTIHQKALKGEISRSDDDYFIRKDGTLDYTCWECRPWHQSDGSIGGIILYTEVTTERKKVELDLIREKERAEAANKAKSDFLATMSHELRTPLNGVIGFSQILDHTDLNCEQRDYLNIVQKSAYHLLEIITDILDTVSLESKKIEINIVETDLQELLKSTVMAVQDKIVEKDLEMINTVDPEIPEMIHCDPKKLKQVIVNLLNNAIKFTKEGSVALFVRKGRLLDNGHSTLKFSIKDTGIGIKEADQKKVFEAFTQADMSSTRQYGGTGLGLSIAKQIINKMGSTLHLNSSPGKGSEFSFELDCVYSEQEDSHGDKSKEGWQVGNSNRLIHNKRILIAEDNTVNMNYLKTSLKLISNDIDILEAKDGKEAYELYKNQKPDLIFMDIVMPHVDGYQATAMIRHHDEEVPIVALTAKAFQEDREASFKSGMNDYLSKPVTINSIKSVLNKYI